MYWLEHFAVVAQDLEETSRFYESLLETTLLERVASTAESQAESAFIKVPHTNSILAILEYHNVEKTRVAAAHTDIGATHLGFSVGSADATLARLGVNRRSTPIPFGPCRGGRSAYLTDPNGVSVQLMELVGRPGLAPVLRGADFWIDHVGIVVGDLERSVSFYEHLLGSRPIARAEWRGTNAVYVADMVGAPGLELDAVHFQIPHTNALLELIQYYGIEQARVRPHVTDIGASRIGLSVSSLDSELARLGLAASESVQIMTGPYRGGRSAYLRDPDGVQLQLTELMGRPGCLPVLVRGNPPDV